MWWTSRNPKFLLLVISDCFRSKHNNNNNDDDNAPDPPIATPFDSTCTNGKDIALHTRDRQGESYGNGVAIIGKAHIVESVLNVGVMRVFTALEESKRAWCAHVVKYYVYLKVQYVRNFLAHRAVVRTPTVSIAHDIITQRHTQLHLTLIVFIDRQMFLSVLPESLYFFGVLLLIVPETQSLTTTKPWSSPDVNSLFALNAECKVLPEIREDWLKEIKEDQLCSRRDEPDCLQFVLGQDVDDENTFYLFE